MTGSDSGFDSLLARQAGALADLAFGEGPKLNFESDPVLPLERLAASDLELDLTDPLQRHFGDYELLERVGRGGMGVVYRALQKSLGREVALKLLAAGPWSSDDFIARFKQEAHSAAKLQHPNIVTVFDIGEQDELNFFTMQLVRGDTLSAYLRRQGGSLEPKVAARMIRVIAEAVDYAHRLGVLHLDLKPNNVLLGENDEPLVADFGLARQLGRSMEISNAEVCGTPAYMAPEQARLEDSKLSPATDVYGLGALLYECLVGRPPFDGTTAQDTIAAVLAQPLRPPRGSVPSLDPDLNAVCCRCLARNAGDRYQSARGLIADLDRYLGRRPVHARPLGPLRRTGYWFRREPRFAAALTLALTALTGGLLSTGLQWQRAESGAKEVAKLLWQSRRDQAGALLGDGKGFEGMALLAQNLREMPEPSAEQQHDDRRLSLAYSQAPVLLRRGHTAPGLQALTLSPDGGLLVTAHADATMRVFDAKTLRPVARASLAGIVGLHPGRPAARLRFVGKDRVVVEQHNLDWTLRPYGPMAVFDIEASQFLEPPAELNNVLDTVFSPNARQVLVRYEADSRVNDQVQLFDAVSWSPLTERVGSPTPRHTPWLVQDDKPLSATVYGTLQPVTVWRSLSERIARLGRPELYALRSWAFSPSGRYLALGDVEGRVFAFDLTAGERLTYPVALGDEVDWVRFSEDGEWLAAGAQNGLVMVFETATTRPLSEPMSHSFPITQLTLRRDRRLLLAEGVKETALWRLPPPSRYPRSAIRYPINPLPLLGEAAGHRHALAAEVGLYGSGNGDGLVSLWRLRDSALRGARGTRQIESDLSFDGERIVQVDGARVRVVQVASEDPVTPWLELPQVPGFSVLANERLLVTCGAELLIYPLAQVLKGQTAPVYRVPLPDSPLRLLPDAGSERVLLAFADSAEGYFEEHLMSFSTVNGQPLAEQSLPGPLRSLGWSKDGRLLWVLGTNPDRVDLLQAADLEHQHRVLPTEGSRISAAHLDASELLFMEQDADGQTERLLRWELEQPAPETLAQMEVQETQAILRLDGMPVTLGARGSFLFASAQRAIGLDQKRLNAPVPAAAVSPDGALLARADRHRIALYDREGTLLMPLLALETSGNDSIARLAFSPAGDALLARTALGRWAYWRLDHDPQAGLLLLDTELSAIGDFGPDPGAWTERPARPDSLFVANALGVEVPARDPRAGPSQIDLGALYTWGPDDRRHELADTLIDMSGMPIGLQQIDGVRYDLRGAIAGGEPPANRPGEQSQVSGYRAAPLRIAVDPQLTTGVHLLFYARQPRPVEQDARYMDVIFHYDDDTQARAVVRCHRHVPGWTRSDSPVPIGWLLSTAATYFWDGYAIPISNPMIDNPFPEKTLNALSLDWEGGVGLPPILFAATLAKAATGR